MPQSDRRAPQDRLGSAREPSRALSAVHRLTLGWGLSVTSLMVGQVALLVWAFDVGGPNLVAVYGVTATLPAAAVTPLVTALAARTRGDRLLRLTVLARAALTALTAAAVAAGLPAGVVVALAAGVAALSGTYRPLQAASLPWLVRTPEALSAANVRATVLENAGGLAGPALGGVLLAVSGPAATVAVAAAFMALALLALAGLRTGDEPAARSGEVRRAGRLAGDLVTGTRALLGVFRGGGMVVSAALQTFTRGMLLVLTVVLALDVLGLASDAVGWLNAMIGVGGIVGGALAGRALRRAGLGRSFTLGVALWGLPLIVLGLAPSSVVAYAALFVVGIGNALLDGAAFTLIPRVVGPGRSAAALGALEMVAFGGIGLGAVAAPALAHWPGTTAVLAVAGVVLVLVAGGYAPVAARVDRTLPQPRAEMQLLQGSPVFAPLPLMTVERLAASAGRADFPPGTEVIKQGEPGHTFYLIVAGQAAVTIDGIPGATLSAGDAFGEIALLHDVPRTATVTAVGAGALTALTVARPDFLAAINGNPASLTYARLLADDRLSRGAALRS